MATIIKNAGEVSRSDMFAVYPEFVLADPAKRGRVILPSQGDVEEMARSIIAEGQLQPCQVRKTHDKKLELVYGFTRHAAVTYINDNGLAPERLKLKIVVSDCNEEEAFRRNIVENRERNVTTPVDDAFNQRRLREEFSWTDEQIAAFYKLSKSRIDQLKKLLTLPRDIQSLVGTLIAPQAAINMADMPVAEQRALVRKFKDADAEQVQEVKDAAAEARADGNGEAEPKPKGNKKKGGKGKPKAKPRIGVSDVKKHARDSGSESAKTDRSLREVKEYFGERFADEEEDQPVRDFAKAFLQFCKGEIDDEKMTKALHKLEGDR